MNATYVKGIIILFFMTILSGCLYPQSELAKNQIPNEEQLKIVQQAVEQYSEDTNGLMPIVTKESDTPIYQKYLIDFSLLKEKGLITEIPATAYENGGVYQYVIITPDEDPRVKLLDLRCTEKIREVNVKLDIYRSKHLYPPFGDEIEKGIYKVDYKELGLKHDPYVVSPFSQQNLPIIMDTEGKLYIDYRKDLMRALEEYDHDYEEGEDIRDIIPDHSPFVPAYSLPYTISDGEPVFLKEKNK